MINIGQVQSENSCKKFSEITPKTCLIVNYTNFGHKFASTEAHSNSVTHRKAI